MTFAQFLAILKARWLSALIALGLTLVLITGITLLQTKQYTAEASVVLDVKPDPVSSLLNSSAVTTGVVATQVDIIQSERVAQAVVRDLKLAENASLRRDWLEATSGQGSIEAWVGELVGRKLTVKPSRDSNVINISYTSPDPRFAAAMANAFVKAYMSTSVELRVDPARQYNNFFDARAKDLREALEGAQSRLSEYQQKHGLVASDERLDVENQRLNELTSQLVSVQAISSESRSRSAQAISSADQLQDIINNPVVSGLRADMARQDAKLQELSARLGDAHPQVVELKANIAELRQKLENETRRVSSSVGINNTINQRREADIRGAVEAQRERILKLKQQRDEASVLLKDVESAQRAYEAVTQRANQTSLESQTTQNNLSVLTTASVPSGPSSPKLTLNIAIAIVLGLLLAMGTVVIREMFDRRVRAFADISDVIGVPVLGQLPKPLRGANLKGRDSLLLPSNVMGRLPSPGR
jgi:chain length determinant protein EpsF